MAECFRPVELKDAVLVPCGRCPNCLERRVKGWAFRLMAEERVSENAHFITLTYNTKFVPLTENGLMTLDPNDLTLFWKRLRKKHEKNEAPKIKYFACGEYGTNRERPHYHAIVFNAFQADIVSSWTNAESGEQLGNVFFGTVTPASIKYTLKYMMKETFAEMVHKETWLDYDDRRPEFRRMSQGLGKRYVTAKMLAWHKADLLNRYYLPWGKQKFPMPRYLKDLIYTKQEQGLIYDHLSQLSVVDLSENEIRLIETWKLHARQRQIEKAKMSRL